MPTAPRLVVRTHAPRRRMLWMFGMLVVVALTVFGAYEFGLNNAGFATNAARTEQGRLSDHVEQLQAEVREQRLQLAARETEHVSHARERTELAKTIGALQAEVAKLQSDLAFYRGVVDNGGPREVVRIQQFRISRGEAPNEYKMRLVLGRPLRPEDTINGKVHVNVEGSNGIAAAVLDLAAVAGVPDGALAFSFRYVETLEQTLRLPDGFTPARTTVEVIPARKGVNPVHETFIWTVEN